MTGIVERLRDKWVMASLPVVAKEAAEEIESLRQQLAESQALVDKVIEAANENGLDSIAALIEWLPDLASRPDSTALDSAIRQAKREAFLVCKKRGVEAGSWANFQNWCQSMADELK